MRLRYTLIKLALLIQPNQPGRGDYAYAMAKHGIFKEDQSDLNALALQHGNADQLLRKAAYR